MKPDENALLRDLASPTFKVGERRGRWAALGVRFPLAMFFIAAPVRLGGPTGFLLRSDFSGYPAAAPNSQLWHGRNNQPLADEHRPKNKQGGTLVAFAMWGACLYHPIDRLARDHWPGQHPDLCWTADKTIVFLLETVHAILDSTDYAGARLPAEALELPPEFVARHAGAAA
ncbi:hypothetical protein V5279_43445 [Bradyrhizobium sp. 26S5]|uniref:DUF7665 family protein n=1 Tax=Bradyrhizobium sp. 26S5 TaxID=3139729 RepID=UPI0030CB1B90